MGYSRVRCPFCGTVIDTSVGSGSQDTPSSEDQSQEKEFIPSTYIAPAGFYGSKEIQYAGLGKRFLAWVVDILILGLITFPITWLLVGPSTLDQDLSLAAFYSRNNIMRTIIGAAIHLPYFIYLEGTRHQSLGKMALDIIVVKEDLKPIGMRESLFRNGLRILYEIPLLGEVMYLIDAYLIRKNARRLGDMAARSYVVEKNYFDFVNADSTMPPSSPTPTTPSPDNN